MSQHRCPPVSEASRRRISAAAAGVSSIGATGQSSSRPAKAARGPIADASLPRKRPMRRDRPGRRASMHRRRGRHRLRNHRHAVVGDDDRRRRRPACRNTGCRPCRPRPSAPSGRERAARNAATTAGSVRRDGVTTSPTRSRRIMAAQSALQGASPAPASRRRRPLLPPTSTATSGRGRCAKRGAQIAAASASRAGVTRCSAVRVTMTFGPVSSS